MTKESVEGVSCWGFFSSPVLLLFLPHKTTETQMLLISATSERTCSEQRISTERDEDAGQAMKEAKKLRFI